MSKLSFYLVRKLMNILWMETRAVYKCFSHNPKETQSATETRERRNPSLWNERRSGAFDRGERVSGQETRVGGGREAGCVDEPDATEAEKPSARPTSQEGWGEE